MGPFNCHGLMTDSAPSEGATNAATVNQHSHTPVTTAGLHEVMADAEVAGYVTYRSTDVGVTDEGHFVPDMDAKFDDALPPLPNGNCRHRYQDDSCFNHGDFSEDQYQEGAAISSASKSASLSAAYAHHPYYLPPSQGRHDVAISSHLEQEIPSRLIISPAVDRQLVLDSRQLTFKHTRGIESCSNVQMSPRVMNGSANSSSSGTSSLLSTSTCPLIQQVSGNVPFMSQDSDQNADQSSEIDYY